MIRFFMVLAAFLIAMAPAFAQSARDISKVEAGRDCAGCNLFQADLSYGEASDRTFAGARLRQSNLRVGLYERTDFRRADLMFADGSAGVFSRARFDHANLENALFINGFFAGAKFYGAKLTNANFAGAELQDAFGLTQAQLNGACGDEFTRLPPGLTIPRC